MERVCHSVPLQLVVKPVVTPGEVFPATMQNVELTQETSIGMPLPPGATGAAPINAAPVPVLHQRRRGFGQNASAA